MNVAFFHQNSVAGVQGGIERYLATLMTSDGGKGVLVCAKTNEQGKHTLGLPLTLSSRLPQWLRFTYAVWTNVFSIRSFLKANDVTSIEFSRPEYALFSFLFKGKKTFTFHGTGPATEEQIKHLIHHACCFLMPFVADELLVIGKDTSGLPKSVRALMKNKIRFLDAWYDSYFSPVPFPDINDGLNVFYAGRLDKMKNPDLLFSIVTEAKNKLKDKINFFYFGSDGEKIPAALRETHIKNGGLLSAEQLAKAIRSCHFGILCSAYGEGSPFIVVETLACGRGYILPPLPGLKETYKTQAGILFTSDYEVETFVRQIEELARLISSKEILPDQIAQGVEDRSKSRAANNALSQLLAP